MGDFQSVLENQNTSLQIVVCQVVGSFGESLFCFQKCGRYSLFSIQNVSLSMGMIWQFENMFVYLPTCC